ncbi:peptidoglycan-binding protein [Actinoplanes sp. NEAU-A12]|uniref:Peptidoglycan-binding protein n=1 Tax=Actinoplanes sandaracinus TaxID=3045177 RepID=A0ABT6WMU9_9ACTN|nr:peptidoglycan-binding protein [Actinoplanes sandaracinus]MDI6101062.1 peptidoglycan-binding protein [Actinoplanes sandaracinus]
MRRRRATRVAAATVTGVVVVAGALATGYTLTAQPEAAAGATEVPTRTVAVTRGTVSQRFRLAGTYGFDGSYSVLHRGDAGILTGVTAAGSTVSRGGVLYRVGGRAVRLLYGDIPAYRDLNSSVTDGADVRQLERNLRALGMDPDHEMTVDTDFTAATAAAVRRLQKSWGVTRTGALPLGSMVFLPGEIRVSEVKAPAGTTAGPEQAVLAGTTTKRVVTANLTAERQNQIKAGDKVTVTLPGSRQAEGEVLRVGRVATAPADGDGTSQPATVDVVLGIQVPAGAPDFDQAPVQINLATAVRRDVLTVPVSALLARPGSGYRVRLASGGYADVEPGLYDDATGLVEVTGLSEGDRVEVPEQ